MKVTTTRGDTLYVDVSLDGYEVNEGDTLTLTVKSSTETEVILIQKVEEVTEQAVEFKILPTDTKDFKYGDYVYDVQLNTADGDVFTVIKPSVFRVTDEVTW